LCLPSPSHLATLLFPSPQSLLLWDDQPFLMG
jgi:hypothetical protein